MLFGFIPLWDTYLSTRGHLDELHQAAIFMAPFFLLEMELLNTNHLCPTPFVVPTLFEEPWSHPGQTHSGQAVISPANCNHSWYLHQPGFLQVLGKQSVYFPRIPTCMYNFEAGYPMLGLISLLLNQGQSSTRLWQVQSHSAELQLSGAFSKSFMKLFIL